MAHIDISISSLDLHISLHIHISVEVDTALFLQLRHQTGLGLDAVGNVEIAVAHIQMDGATGFQLAVLVDDEGSTVLSGSICLLVSRYGNIPHLRGSFAIDYHFTILGGKVKVLLRRDGFHVRPVVADEDIPLPGGNADASFLRRHRLHDSDVSVVRPD